MGSQHSSTFNMDLQRPYGRVTVADSVDSGPMRISDHGICPSIANVFVALKLTRREIFFGCVVNANQLAKAIRNVWYSGNIDNDLSEILANFGVTL